MFRQALEEIVRRLEQAKTYGLLRAYALIGGLATGAWGSPRATHDIDFAVAATGDNTKLAQALGARFRSGGPDDPLPGVFSLSIKSGGDSVPVQLVVLPPRWTDLVLNHVQPATVFDSPVPVVSWQALVLLKLYAGGPQDMTDARAILTVRQPKPHQIEDLARLAATVGLAQDLRNLFTQGA
ncbi:MAG: hypothetical protein ACOYXR_12700 [Nitrospirota bacterium]